jgi:single-strand DNA-binding protein
MASVNKAILVGRLEKDPEIRHPGDGTNAASFTIATSETWLDKQDNSKKGRTELHNIVVTWQKLGEYCGQYLAKGKLVYLEGRIETRSWGDDTGNKHYSTEIVAQKIQLLGPQRKSEGGEPVPSESPDETEESMASINKVILVGNLGRDPELRHTGGGRPVASFSMATSEKWIDKQDNSKKEKTEWHKIVAWQKLGEFCGEYLAKGKQIYVEGSLQTRSWDDKTGNKRNTTEVVAQRIQLLGSPGSQRKSDGGEPLPPEGTDETPAEGGGEEDVPF